MKILPILIFLFLLTSFAKAQACGPIFLRMYLKDSKGQIIKNAKIETFDNEFKNKTFPLDKSISWGEEEQSYFGAQSLGGEAFDIGFRISADGFETFETVIDLPFGWHAYSITLKAKKSDEITNISKLTVIKGSVSKIIGQWGNKVKITVFDKEKRVVFSQENLGEYFSLFLPKGKYDLEFSADGFKTTFVKNFEVPSSENEKRSKEKELNITLEVRDVETLPNTINN